MSKVKPFKASKILGNPAEVRSRFMNPHPRQPSRQEKDSPSTYKPAVTRPPSNYTRESGLLRTTPVRKKVSTFGESVVHYLNHGLHGVPSPTISPSKGGQLTTPRTPTLLSRPTHSSAVKSTEEIELEECKRQTGRVQAPGRLTAVLRLNELKLVTVATFSHARITNLLSVPSEANAGRQLQLLSVDFVESSQYHFNNAHEIKRRHRAGRVPQTVSSEALARSSVSQ